MRSRTIAVALIVLSTACSTSSPRSTPDSTDSLAAALAPTSPPTTVASTGVASTAPPDPLSDDALVAFVETARERPFEEPPSIRVLPAGSTPPAEDFERIKELDWAFAVLLGLAAPDDRVAFDEFIESRRETAGWGRCCPVQAQEVADDPERTAAIIVRELVHGLDAAPISFGGTLEERAFRLALAEGNAVRVEERFVNTLGRSIDEFRDEDDEVPPGVPSPIVRLVQAPYALGYHFAVAVAEATGEAAIDAAFEAGPASAEHVLFPETFLAGEEPLEVDRPPTPDGSSFVRFGTVGVVALQLAIEPQVGAEAALDVVRPWSGDAYTMARRDDQICIAADIVMDDAPSAAALADALRAAVTPQQITAADRTVRFENCVAVDR